MGDTSEYVVMYIFARLVASFNGPLRVDLVVLRLGLQMLDTFKMSERGVIFRGCNISRVRYLEVYLGRAPIWIAERAGVWLSVC
eukprot:249148-Amorphochlora_amoeboformis.AAC.1